MQLNNIEVRRYDMISVQFPAGSNATKLVFPDQPQLRGAKVHGIDLVFSLRDISGKTNLNYLTGGGGVPVNIANTFMTLYFDGMNGVENMPLSEISHITSDNTVSLIKIQNNNNGILAMNGQIVSWTKSYLTLAQPSPPAVDGVFVIGVYYTPR